VVEGDSGGYDCQELDDAMISLRRRFERANILSFDYRYSGLL